jgi:TonB family protein
VSEYTGEVVSVDILTSTGHPILDRSCVKTFKMWKFRPHIVTRVKIPIEFSMPTHAASKQ